MKHFLFSVALTIFFGATNLFSQTVNDIPFKDIDTQYVQIVGTSKLFSAKVTIRIDFGQNLKALQVKDARIKDKDGKPIVFNSMIDALNFMSENGYDYEDAYVVTVGNQLVYHYLLKRSE